MFIRNEIDVGAYAPPSANEVEPLLLQVRTQRFHTPQEYHAALEKYRITEDDLKTYLLWQLTLLRFIDIRFRAGIQISEQDIGNTSTGAASTGKESRSRRQNQSRDAP